MALGFGILATLMVFYLPIAKRMRERREYENSPVGKAIAWNERLYGPPKFFC
jgi:cytochrome c oxidase assembly factor CtaG